MLNFVIVFFAIFVIKDSFLASNFGPKYPPTKGEVWPKPLREIKSSVYYTFNPSKFQFKIACHSCDTLTNAVSRYQYLISSYCFTNGQTRRNCHSVNRKHHKKLHKHVNTPMPIIDDHGVILSLKIELMHPCEDLPYFGMDESYNLTVSESPRLVSTSLWGILRGLETFSQLFYYSGDSVMINSTYIEDSPRYSHRGLMLDTSRHYISTRNIFKTLDAMAYNKLNVLHWHIVDDQSFPYESIMFPELSAKGAYDPRAVYTKKDIDRIVYYAKHRGIRVIPEFDVPGHTRSWGEAYPEILTKCYEGNNVVGLGPMNPINNATYTLIRELFSEVSTLFPDDYLHIGGDEVQLKCWASNPELQEYMSSHGMNSVTQLHSLFMRHVIPLLRKDVKVIAWQEVSDENVNLSKDTLIQVWKNNPAQEMINILKKGYRVLFSSAWYLDYNLGHWENLYQADPREMINNTKLENGIVGGEACMWGEMADDHNLMSRVWPRASAAAERLWSSTREDMDRVRRRIEEQTCRLVFRGIAAEPPNGPSYCSVLNI